MGSTSAANPQQNQQSGKQAGKRKRQPSRLDWDTGKWLYAQGYSYSAIAERLGTSIGTVRSQAYRDRWKDQREHVEEMVKAEAEEKLKDVAKSASEAWSDKMVSALQRTSQAIEELSNPKDHTLSSLKMLEEVRKLHVETGRRLFGLDKQDAQTLVQVNVGDLAGQAAIEVDTVDAETASPDPESEAGDAQVPESQGDSE